MAAHTVKERYTVGEDVRTLQRFRSSALVFQTRPLGEKPFHKPVKKGKRDLPETVAGTQQTLNKYPCVRGERGLPW